MFKAHDCDYSFDFFVNKNCETYGLIKKKKLGNFRQISIGECNV